MIDDYWTFRLYGYHSDELKDGSGKPCVRVCEGCSKYQVLPRCKCGDLCHSCAMTDDERCRKISVGNKNPSDETRQKRVAALTGHSCSTETRMKMSEAQMREKHWNWKGGITGWRGEVMRSSLYKNWRTSVFERDDYTCQMCNMRGGKLEAHHIRPVRDHKNDLMMWDIDNGITLCKQCHDTTKQRENEFIERFDNTIKGGR